MIYHPFYGQLRPTKIPLTAAKLFASIDYPKLQPCESKSQSGTKRHVLGQIKKFREEFKEFIVAKDAGKKRAAMDELADMYIVACSLLRLSTSSGLKAMNDFTWLICEHEVKFESLQAPINRKMDANVARKWVYKNGNYHHV